MGKRAAKASPKPATGAERGKFGPKSPAARRARQTDVEEMLLDGATIREIGRALAEKHDAHPTTLRSDCRAVLRRWKRADLAHADTRRIRAIRRLERMVRSAEADERYADAVTAMKLQAHLEGWGVVGTARAARENDVPVGAVVLHFATKIGPEDEP